MQKIDVKSDLIKGNFNLRTFEKQISGITDYPIFSRLTRPKSIMN